MWNLYYQWFLVWTTMPGPTRGGCKKLHAPRSNYKLDFIFFRYVIWLDSLYNQFQGRLSGYVVNLFFVGAWITFESWMSFEKKQIKFLGFLYLFEGGEKYRIQWFAKVTTKTFLILIIYHCSIQKHKTTLWLEPLTLPKMNFNF